MSEEAGFGGAVSKNRGTSSPASRGGLSGSTTQDELAASFEERRTKWYLDVRHTPCARNSLMHGIMGGLAAGLLYYLKSNVVMRSCDLAVIGFAVTAYGSWRYCRHQMIQQHRAVRKTVERMNEIVEEREQERSGQPPSETS